MATRNDLCAKRVYKKPNRLTKTSVENGFSYIWSSTLERLVSVQRLSAVYLFELSFYITLTLNISLRYYNFIYNSPFPEPAVIIAAPLCYLLKVQINV